MAKGLPEGPFDRTGVECGSTADTGSAGKTSAGKDRTGIRHRWLGASALRLKRTHAKELGKMTV